MKKILSILLLAGALMGGAHGAHAQSVQEQNTLQQAKSAAATLLEQGQYAQAFDAYTKLLAMDPLDDMVNLGYARAALRQKKPGQAVMAYERLLEVYPRDAILLKELAYALSMQNDEQRAAMELAKNSKATAQENADLTAQWKKQHSRTQVTGKLSAGLIFDSNVNTGPASNDVSIGIWDISLHDGAAQPSMAAYLGGQVDAAYRLEPQGSWWLVGSANAFVRYNMSSELYDMGLSSSEYLNASAGMRYLNNDVLLDIRARAQLFDYAFEQNVISVGPQVSFAYAVHPKVHLISKANIDTRAYSENHSYNGWYGSVGQFVRVFFGEARHAVTFGGRYLGGSAKESVLSYDGFEASLDFTFMLPHDIRLAPFVAYGGEYFHGPATALEADNRVDYRFRTGVGLAVPLNDAWTVELSYQYQHNDSNSELYTYSQHIVSSGLSWSF